MQEGKDYRTNVVSTVVRARFGSKHVTILAVVQQYCSLGNNRTRYARGSLGAFHATGDGRQWKPERREYGTARNRTLETNEFVTYLHL